MSDNLLFESCRAKQLRIKNLFAGCADPQVKYEKIIELGRALPPYPKELMTPCRVVKGCQSTMYLHTSLVGTTVHFQVHSDALISAGLAALLLAVYNDESAATILRCPPDFLEELNIHSSLSPSRSNGLSSLFLRMKQEALQFLL
jgi:cysteine desulfuration protein SufE